MVVWFRHGSCTVGVEDGVVRAGDYARLTRLLDVAQALQTEREQLLSGAEAEIAKLRAEATQEVESLLAEAHQARARGYEDGRAKGMEDAVAEWTEGALREAASTQRSLMRQTQRLSHIVALALERIVEQEDRAALFQRALNTISRLVRDVPMATLRVSPSELGPALTAVSAFAPCAAGRLQLEVKGDAALEPGSCLFESDQGVIDAGLKTQLAAIQRAMDRVATQMPLEPAPEAAGAQLVGLETPATAGEPPRAQNDEQDREPESELEDELDIHSKHGAPEVHDGRVGAV